MLRKISQREDQILQLISKGYSNKDIADELFISPHTAKSHRKSLFIKLRVNNSACLVRAAFEHKLIQI